MIYKNNSRSKDKIRKEWAGYIKKILKSGEKLKLITLPAAELNDLEVFAAEGLFKWEKRETDSYEITEGEIVCFESRTPIYQEILKKLVNAKEVFQYDIGLYFRSKYQSIVQGDGKNNIFPINAINLDFDGYLSKYSVPISELVEMIFTFQARFRLPFSLFLTFPVLYGEDTEDYLDSLKAILDANLKDVEGFKKIYKQRYTKNPSYEEFIMIAIAKIIIKCSSYKYYRVTSNDFYIYKGGGSRKLTMISMLFNFEYIEPAEAGQSLYFSEVEKTLKPISKI